MAPIPLFIVLGVAIVGILSHKVGILGGPKVEAPPLDFGTGSMFDFIAGRYDAINRVLAFSMDVHWRKVMIKRIKNHLDENDAAAVAAGVASNANPYILDVATGTADVALLTSQMIPSATILGVDPSNGMLDVGRKKITKRNKDDKITLEWADARDLSAYPANTFDAATMAFGIRNVPERDVALCQIYKVLKPNALFCILEFSNRTTKSPMGKVAGFFIQRVVPFVGGILSGQRRAYKHLQNSIQNFPSPEDFTTMINGLQCSNNDKDNDDDDNSEQRISFHVEEVQDVAATFGAVQIYSIKSLKRTVPASP